MADSVKKESTAGAGAAARVFLLPTPEELARAAAGRLWGIARERAPSGPVHIALSGGGTPRKAYELLSGEPYRTRFPWTAVHFWQVDERFVPPGDPRSNRRMIEEALLLRAPIPPGRFHGVDTGLSDPRAAARSYEEELRAAFPGASRKPPRFDAVILGIGADGHTASLFPWDAVPETGGEWVVCTEGRDPAVPRVSMSMVLLNAAARIIFLVQGKEKAKALRETVEAWRDPSLRPAAPPAGRLAPARGTVVVLADVPAGSGLPPSWANLQ